MLWVLFFFFKSAIIPSFLKEPILLARRAVAGILQLEMAMSLSTYNWGPG